MTCNGSGRSCAPPFVRFARTTAIGLLGLLAFASTASAQTFTIDRAEWQTSDGGRLRVEGNGRDGSTITIRNANAPAGSAALGTTTVDDGEWDRRFRGLTQVPCTVSAQQSGSTAVITRAVKNRPANCGPVVGAPAPACAIRVNNPTSLAFGNVNVLANAARSTTVTNTGTAACALSVARTGTPEFALTTLTPLNVAVGGTATVSATYTPTAAGPDTGNLAISGSGIATVNVAMSGTGVAAAPPPNNATFSINDVTVAEGGTANFTVTRGGTTTNAVTVVASTANGTAIAPGDFTARANVTLSFAAGVTTQTFAVTTIDDTVVEAVPENFTVNLTNPSGGSSITDAQGIGTINDNDAPPQPNATFSINDVTVAEGGTASFTVTRAGTTTTAVSVVANTANGTATAGSDYTARTGVTLNFAAGVTTQAFTVATLTDAVTEGNETFNVNLSGASAGASITDAQGIGTITNVAPPPPNNATFTINDVTVAEGGTASFTVTRAGTTTTAVSVVANTANGTATAGSDYTARANVTLNFAAGVTTQAFTVATLTDAVTEGNETFNVNLSGASAGASIADAQGVGTITNVATPPPPPTACAPAANINNPNGSHVGCFTNALTNAVEYTGPGQCVACHDADARNMHGSLHYQQNGPTDFVTNIAGIAGEGPADRPVILPNQPALNIAFAINTYCGTHENSPRFTCAGCHVGNGRFPKTPTEMAALPLVDQRTELANIDCLMCHQQTYKRFPDWLTSNDNPLGTSEGFGDLVLQNVTLGTVNGVANQLVPAIGSTVTRTGFAGIPNVNALTLDFQFRPAGATGSVLPLPAGVPIPGGAMALTTEQAAERVHRTTRNTCLNCHANAGAADGAKRGDISSANRDSTDVNLDRHMANAAGGSNMTCSTCHNVDDTPTVNDTGRQTTHRMRGRGLDLRANDSATRFTCDSGGCHNAATVHNAVTNGATFNTHSNKVACQTCHIPRYGKGVATEVSRDWQKPHVTQTACNGRGGWLPEEIKSSTATPPAPINPTYQWFDGTSQVYYLKETLAQTPTKPLPANIATAFGMATGTQAYVLGRPNGGPGVAAAKIYPMKEHWGKLARATANPGTAQNPAGVPVNSLVPQSTFEFFRTGSFCRAVAEGLGQNPDTACGTNVQNTNPPAGAVVVPVHTYQTLNHGVEPQAASLGAGNTCGTCHDVAISPFTTGKPLRMFLERDMGYAVTRAGITAGTNGNYSCSVSCHGNQTGNFTNIHSRSQHRNEGCNACHSAITGR